MVSDQYIKSENFRSGHKMLVAVNNSRHHDDSPSLTASLTIIALNPKDGSHDQIHQNPKEDVNMHLEAKPAKT